MNWKQAFGEDWCVPAEIQTLVSSGELTDESDPHGMGTCPAFGVPEAITGSGDTVFLVVDHIDPDRREYEERYMVIYHDYIVYLGDDVHEAIHAWRAARWFFHVDAVAQRPDPMPPSIVCGADLCKVAEIPPEVSILAERHPAFCGFRDLSEKTAGWVVRLPYLLEPPPDAETVATLYGTGRDYIIVPGR